MLILQQNFPFNKIFHNTQSKGIRICSRFYQSEECLRCSVVQVEREKRGARDCFLLNNIGVWGVYYGDNNHHHRHQPGPVSLACGSEVEVRSQARLTQTRLNRASERHLLPFSDLPPLSLYLPSSPLPSSPPLQSVAVS